MLTPKALQTWGTCVNHSEGLTWPPCRISLHQRCKEQSLTLCLSRITWHKSTLLANEPLTTLFQWNSGWLIYDWLIVPALTFQIVKKDFRVLCLALEGPGSNRGKTACSECSYRSIPTCLKGNLDDNKKQKLKFQLPQHGAGGYANLKLSRWWHNLDFESNYFQQSGSCPEHNSFETCCILTFSWARDSGERTRALKFR